MDQDLLRRQLSEIPAFRALLRAVEARFYQQIELPQPVLDLGCGDGHFASVTFHQPLDVGLDPWWQPLQEAHQREAYRLLIQADGARMPFTDASFASAISNSVLEHIPNVEAVLAEVTRVLRPGAPFYFCVPSEHFLAFLSIGHAFDALHLSPLAHAYRRFFNQVSRHHHSDSVETWQVRLQRAGLVLDRWWSYFSPSALAALEWGHYWGLPSLITKKLTGRWVVGPIGPYLWATERLLRPHYEEPLPDEGAYHFIIAHKPGV